MTRVALLGPDQLPLAAQHYLATDDLGPIVSALATVPELLGPVMGFIDSARGAGAVGMRLKEFATLRTSTLQGCTYGINTHTVRSLDSGLTRDEVRALRGEIPLEEAFPLESERALIRWIDALAGATGPIPDDVWLVARQHWEECLLIEISVTVGATMFLNRFATGLQLPTVPRVLRRLADQRVS